MRRIGPIAVVFGVLLAALPLAAGVMTKKLHEAWLAQLAEEWQDGVIITTESYWLGWLSSEAVVVVTPRNKPNAKGLRFEEKITHGPLPWSDLLSGQLPRPVLAVLRSEWRPELPAELKKALGDEPPLQLEARITFDRHLQLRVDGPPISAEGIEWQGVSGRGDFHAEEGAGELDAPGLKIPAAKLSIEGLHCDFRVRASRTGVPLGEWKSTLAKLEVGTAGEPKHVVVKGVELSESSEERPGDLVDAVLRAGVQRATWNEAGTSNEEDYGPASLELAARNLDLAVISAVRAKVREARKSAAPDALQASAILEGLPALLERKPVLELTRLRVETRSGALDWSGRMWIGDLPAGPPNPLMLLSALRAEARLVTPVRMLHRMVEQQIARLLSLVEGGPNWNSDYTHVVALRTQLFERWRAEAGLQRDGDNYVARLRYGEGQWRLNGVPFEVSKLAFDIATISAAGAPGAQMPPQKKPAPTPQNYPFPPPSDYDPDAEEFE